MTRHLIITADDYGPHWYINNGILEAIEANAVTAVSVLCNRYDGYDFGQAVDALVTAVGTRNIGIGCHLSLTAGAPLTDAASLVDEKGNFYRIDDFHFGLSETHLYEVETELEAQIGRLNSYLLTKSVQLDHISCHHGIVGMFTPYNALLLKIVQRNKWTCTVRNPLIISKDPRFHEFKPSFMNFEGFLHAVRIIKDELDQTTQDWKIAELVRLFKEVMEGIEIKHLREKAEVFRKSGNPVPTYLIDIYYHQAHVQILKKLIRCLPYNGPYSYGEMMVHLGSGNLRKAQQLRLSGIDTDYFTARRTELKVLKTFFGNRGFAGTDIQCVPMKSVPLFRCLDDEGGQIVYA